jgi:type III secretion protein D
MKQLRILTGRHAGAQLELNSRCYRIGSDEDADIQIIDWQSDSVTLQAGDDDMFHLALGMTGSSAAPQAVAEVMVDFVARRFQDVVLCIGPAAAPWPSDIQLLAGLMARDAPGTAAGKPQPGSRLPGWLPAGVAALLATVGVGIVHFSREAEAATQPVATADISSAALADQVRRALEGSAGGLITVATSGRSVVVRGLVNHPSDVAALRERLTQFPAGRLVHTYASADDVAQRIADGLALPGLRVTHQGGGVFRVGGAAHDLERVRDSVAQLTRDLTPLAKRIEVDATALPPTDHLPLSAVMVDEEIQYVQTRDGVKHLKVTPRIKAERAEGSPLSDPPKAP